MWEARDRERHYTSSKVMLWVALDRSVRLAEHLDRPDTRTWEQAREALRADILSRAWSPAIGAYAGAYGSDELDASVLLMPLVDFLPATDERMAATIRRVERDLGDGVLVRRWAGDPNGFLLCSYWLVECLAMLGESEGARRRFEQLTGMANDLGLLAEMADPRTGEQLGNFPQAFSHIGVINAAWRLAQVEGSAGLG
jgi:GH15 family glucan-1,4-alpha-glucosidase